MAATCFKYAKLFQFIIQKLFKLEQHTNFVAASHPAATAAASNRSLLWGHERKLTNLITIIANETYLNTVKSEEKVKQSI